MMRRAGVACLHSGTKEVFQAAEDEGGVVDGVDFGSQEGAGELVGGQRRRKSTNDRFEDYAPVSPGPRSIVVSTM